MVHQLVRYRTALLLLIMLLGGCGQSAAPTGQGDASGAASQGGAVTPVFAFSEAVVGRNRVAIGLLRGGTPVNDPGAKVHLRFFDLDANSTQPRLEADATYYGQGLPAGFYIAYPTLDKPGNWGVEIETRLSGQAEPSRSRLRLEVKDHSVAPNVGEPAILAKTLTVADVPDLAQLSSGPNPDPALYQISLDAALKSGKPTAVLFATPAFCRTAMCGPSLAVLQSLQKQYGDRVNFIHVEVYKYPFAESFQITERAAQENRAMTAEEQRQAFADAFVAWHLPSEPWLFLIDPKGTIAARYEGGITKEELGPALERLIAGQPVLP